MGDDDTAVHRFLTVLPDVIRNTLGGLSHRLEVHAVGARAYDAAQACSSECYVLIEALLYLILVVFYGSELSEKGVFFTQSVQPFLELFSCIHKGCTSCLFIL